MVISRLAIARTLRWSLACATLLVAWVAFAQDASIPTATPIGPEASTTGAIDISDPNLDLVLGLPAEVPWRTDVYTLPVTAGQAIIIRATCDFRFMLTVFDDQHGPPATGHMANAGETREYAYVATEDAQAYILVIATSPALGAYSLDTHTPTQEELDEYFAHMPVEAELADGVTQTVTVPCTNFSDYVHAYAVEVPSGTTALTLEAHSDVSLAVMARHGRPIVSLEVDSEYVSANGTGDETLRISLTDSPPLRPGRYFVTVLTLVPMHDREGTCPFDFTLTARFTRTVLPSEPIIDSLAPPAENRVEGPLGGQLTALQPAAGRIMGERPFQVWSIQVPEGTTLLAIGTRNATGRLDLIARGPDEPAPTSAEAFLQMPHHAFSARDNEGLEVRPDSGETTLTAGEWTIYVFDFYSVGTSDYEIIASLDAAIELAPPYTPPSAAELADLPPLRRAIPTTVQISVAPNDGELAMGSGTVITPDGLILTNHHVVGHCESSNDFLFGCIGDLYRNPDGSAADLYIGVSDESQSQAEQHYIGHVVRSLPDADLALVQIVSDLEGRPPQLPIPFAPIAIGLDALHLADPVTAIGYPAVAAAGGRISLSVTQGIVTGFSDDHGQRTLVNIDANIAQGNSGGSLVSQDGVLVGVPSNFQMVPDTGDRQNYARPLNLLPAEWLSLLREHGAAVQ